MEQFEQIMSNWAKATGLATVAVGADGRYISECYNFTEFCIDLTRKSPEGCRRCEKCDREGKGVYFCHAGLIDFGIELKIGNEVGGSVRSQGKLVSMKTGILQHYIRSQYAVKKQFVPVQNCWGRF